MGDKMNGEYFEPGATAFNYNNVTGGADSASGGSGGSGMECLQLRSPPGPFHYLISEQAKSLVALQELQNEVGALLEFRDLVIETFPNLRSKMAPSTPASGTRRDWEPGVRVRRKLAGAGATDARTKPQPSVQDSGFSTETSCKDAQSQSRSRPLEDELWALLDVIQRKGVRLRDEAEQLRTELDERHPPNTAEESFTRALAEGNCPECADVALLRAERDALLLRAAALEAAAASSPPAPLLPPATPLGRLDEPLGTPSRPPRVATPDSKKIAAILLESNPVELQRQLLSSTVQNQVLCKRLRRAAEHRTVLLERLERARDINEDLKFRLEEKTAELETARQRHERSSMRELEPLHMPSDADSEERIADTPRRRPSRIPLHTAHKGAAPRPPPRPPSAHSARSVQSAQSRVPVRRSPASPAAPDAKTAGEMEAVGQRSERLPDYGVLFPRLRPLPADLVYDQSTQAYDESKLAYDQPTQAYDQPNLALELSNSILYENADSVALRSLEARAADSLWNGKPQHYFESMNYGEGPPSDDDEPEEYDSDSLAP